MSAVLQALVEDGSLVADAAVRLGVLKDDRLLAALTAAEPVAADEKPDPLVVEKLRHALNGAIKWIEPVTLRDLRDGWQPHRPQLDKRPVKFFFFLCSVALMLFCAYGTQVYERARSTYATMLELQDARGAEQAMRLYGMLKRNEADVVASLKDGKKDFLYDVFGKALFDLKAIELKSLAYAELSDRALNDIEMLSSPTVFWVRLMHPDNPAERADIAELLKQQKYGPRPPDDLVAPPVAPLAAMLANADPAKAVDIQQLLENYLGQLVRFNSSIKVAFNPLQPPDYSPTLFKLRNGIAFVGAWVLPALYGMLGAIVFYMRSLLNPLVPDPHPIRIIFRVLLGGFAGIIVVWFWTPSSQKPSQGEFVTLTSFGVAFLVGFSTDIFFSAVDRLVQYANEAIGGGGGGPKPPGAGAAAPAR